MTNEKLKDLREGTIGFDEDNEKLAKAIERCQKATAMAQLEEVELEFAAIKDGLEMVLENDYKKIFNKLKNQLNQ